MNKLREAAHDYHDRGLPITLCPLGGKNPLGEGWTDTYPGKAWQRKKWSKREIDRAFKIRGELNVGCLWGPRSKLIDFEQDSAEAKAAFAELFHGVDAPVTPTFESTRGPHRLFAWHPKLDNIGKAKIDYKGLEVLIGANGKGSQSLLPPSTTNRVTRRWLIPLDDCPPAKLPDLVIDRLFSDSGSGRQTLYTETQAIACVSVSLCKHPSEAIGEAIAASLPTGTGHRHRRLFHFARLLKAIPSLASADVQSLRPIMQEWYRQAFPKIGTRNFDESWTDFAHAWRNVRFPAGQEPIRMMYEQALLAPLPPIAERYETVEVKRLIVLCRALQQASGDKPFYLACRTAGELLGISHVLANKWIRLLTIDNVLLLVTPGSIHRAAEYRYLGSD